MTINYNRLERYSANPDTLEFYSEVPIRDRPFDRWPGIFVKKYPHDLRKKYIVLLDMLDVLKQKVL